MRITDTPADYLGQDRGVLTHSHYLWRHEPAFYGWVEGQPPSKKPPSDELPSGNLTSKEIVNIHPTQKPVELFIRPIEYHTEVGDICYEPFLGSGTQIIAAEKLGRRCYAMDLEPLYVDIARMRWEAFTGKATKMRESNDGADAITKWCFKLKLFLEK